MSASRAWNESSPADTEFVGVGAQDNRYLEVDIRERMAIDHAWNESVDYDGEHNQVTLRKQVSNPTYHADKGFLYTKDVSDEVELFYLDSKNQQVKLTSDGLIGNAGQSATFSDVTIADDLTVGDDLAVTGLATIGETLGVTGIATFDVQAVFTSGLISRGDIELGAGDSLTGEETSGISLGTHFSVVHTSGNTSIAGTLDVTGVTTFTARAEFASGLISRGDIELGAGDELIGDSSTGINLNDNFIVLTASGNTTIEGTLDVAGATAVTGLATVSTGIVPNANDGAYLGTTSLSFSDLFLASGAVINFANSNMVVTHSAGALAITGGELGVGTAPSQIIHAKKDQNGTRTTIRVENATDADGSGVSFHALADDCSTSLYAHSTSQAGTIYGVNRANAVELLASGSSGLLIGTGAGDDPIIFGSNDVETARITSTGFGIFTTPSYALHVSSKTQNKCALFYSSDAVTFVNIGDSTSANVENQGFAVNGDALYLRTGGLNRLNIAGTGVATFTAEAVFTGGLTSNGHITLGTGDDLIGSASSDILINTDKFTVDGATGNTRVDGNLGIGKAGISPLDINLPTHNFEIIDASATGGARNGNGASWLEIQINGSTFYVIGQTMKA